MAQLDQNEIDSILIEAASALHEAGLRDLAAAWRTMFFTSLEYLRQNTSPRDFREDLSRFTDMARRMLAELPDLG